MAWALGDRILSAQIPDNEPAQLAAAFELLTGIQLGWARSDLPRSALATDRDARRRLDRPGVRRPMPATVVA